jgi:type II secretory pathway pseudopilin PulG
MTDHLQGSAIARPRLMDNAETKRLFLQPHAIIISVVIIMTTATLWFLAMAYQKAVNSSQNVQSIESIHRRQQEILDTVSSLKQETETLRTQNIRSMDDRDGIHETQGRTMESQKRIEASLDRVEKFIDQVKKADADRRKRQEVKKSP